MKPSRHLLILALMTVAAGCGQKDASTDTNASTPAATPPVANSTVVPTGPDTTVYKATMRFGGVTFMASSMRNSATKTVQNSNSKPETVMTAAFGGHDLVLSSSGMMVDGKSYGTLVKGDTIKIADDGRVFWNGQLLMPR